LRPAGFAGAFSVAAFLVPVVPVVFAGAGAAFVALVAAFVVRAAAAFLAAFFVGAAAAFCFAGAFCFGAPFLGADFLDVVAFEPAFWLDLPDAAVRGAGCRAGEAAGGCSSPDELITVTVPAAGITVVSSCDGHRIRSIDPITPVISPSRSGPFPDDRRMR
jgi:hypothetical protein